MSSFCIQEELSSFLFLWNEKKTEEALKKTNVSSFLKNYLLWKNKKNLLPQEEKDKTLFELIVLANNSSSFSLPPSHLYTHQRLQPFYYLMAANQSVLKKEQEYALKFYFQSFYLFLQWKNQFVLEDRLVFLNEWYFHFLENLDFLTKNQDLKPNEHLTTTILNSADLACQIPYSYFVHPKLNLEEISHYLLFVGQWVLKNDANFELTSLPQFQMTLFKIYLVNGVSLFEEHNYLKADLYFSKLLSYFEAFPASENLFLIYQEALKNKIMISLKLKRQEETPLFLKKYLHYSQSIYKLSDNWNDLKEFLELENQMDEILHNQEIQEMLKTFHLTS